MDVIIVSILLLILHTYLVKWACVKYKVHSESYLWILFLVHIVFSCVYLYMALSSPSDSLSYYNKPRSALSWFELWGTSTTFIQFLSWPFSNFLNLSYISVMIIFSYIGFIGVMFFYLSAKENVSLNPLLGKYTAVELVFLLPNLHYWTASLGKGSVIVFGIALFTFGLSRFDRRYLTLLFGGFVVFMVRPHILFAILLSVMLALMVSGKKLKTYIKVIVFAAASVVFFFISDEVAEFTAVEDFNVLDSEMLSSRAAELGKSGSGVNIQNYSLPMKMFTFWFRPLFIDGQGLMGLVVSFENLIYLIMFYMILRYGISNFKKWNGWFVIGFFVFLFASVALAQVTGNLGIAIRQKAQIMPFFFIIYLKALTYKDVANLTLKKRKFI